MNWKVGFKRYILVLWITNNIWKIIITQPRVAVAYPVNLSSLNWYNYSYPMSTTFILQIQLIFSIVQPFFSEGPLHVYGVHKLYRREKKLYYGVLKLYLEHNSSTHWSMKVVPVKRRKVNQLSYRYSGWGKIIFQLLAVIHNNNMHLLDPTFHFTSPFL